MASATSKRPRRAARGDVKTTQQRPGGETTTVRITAATHEKLRQIADESGDRLQTVLEKAVEHYRRKLFFDAADEAYAALRADPEAWAEELAERRLYENTTRARARWHTPRAGSVSQPVQLQSSGAGLSGADHDTRQAHSVASVGASSRGWANPDKLHQV